MTCGTTGETLYVIGFNELLAQTDLVGGRCVRHIKHFVVRPEIAFRVTMTIETPFHRQRLALPRKRHLIDPSMTGGATDAFADVNAVIEIDILGKIVYSRPSDRSSRAVTFANRFQFRANSPHLRMAVHTNFCGRNVGERRVFDGGVAIAAIDT